MYFPLCCECCKGCIVGFLRVYYWKYILLFPLLLGVLTSNRVISSIARFYISSLNQVSEDRGADKVVKSRMLIWIS